MSNETVQVFFQKALAMKQEHDLMSDDDKAELDRLMQDEIGKAVTKIEDHVVIQKGETK